MIKLQKIGDQAAVSLSLLCMAHCLLFPIVLILVPPVFGAMAFNDELVHRWLLLAVLPISSVTLMVGYAHHRRLKVLAIGLGGLTLLVLASLLGHDLFGGYGEVGLTVVSTGIITYGHLLNFRFRRKDALANSHQQDSC